MSLKGLPKLGGIKRRKQPTLNVSGGRNIISLVDSTVAYIARLLGSDGQAWKVAERVVKLQETFPRATIPELIVYQWLEQQQIRFIFQANAFGGRVVRGGLLPDFVIEAGGGMAWNIQGDYWHSKKFDPNRDDSARVRLLGNIIEGIKVETVVFIWEGRLYRSYPHVLEAAIAGVELGK